MRSRIDVRIKCILLVFINYLFLRRLVPSYELELLTFIFLIYAIEGYWKIGLKLLILSFVLIITDHYLVPILDGGLKVFISTFAGGGRYMLPGVYVGILVIKTSSRELIQGLRSWHIPEALIYAFAVMLRFLPSIKEDYRQIKEGLALRGYPVNVWTALKHPILLIELVLVPLLLSSGRKAQELTVAMLTKGAGLTGQKSSYQSYSFRWIDWIFLVLIFVCLISLETRRWI